MVAKNIKNRAILEPIETKEYTNGAFTTQEEKRKSGICKVCGYNNINKKGSCWNCGSWLDGTKK